jgi:hypothetical protein
MNNYIGLIIGKNGETIQTLHQKTGCFIFIPKDSKPGEDFRILQLSGSQQGVLDCIKEMERIMESVIKIYYI